MNWSSVKNLLIAILLAANLFIIFNIVRQDRERNYIDEKVVRDAVAILKDRGLGVDIDTVPLKKFDASVYESSYNDEYYTQVAETLSGSKRDLLLSLPDGGFSISAINGSLVEFDSEFGFLYQKNDTFRKTAYIDITPDNIALKVKAGEGIGGSVGKKLNKKAKAFLDSCFSGEASPETEMSAAFRNPKNGLCYVYAVQKLGDYDVHSHYAVCVFDGEEMIGAYGRWFFSGFRAVHDTQLADQVNILFADFEALRADAEDAYELPQTGSEEIGKNADKNVKPLSAKVERMEACYVTYWNADKTALYFIPAWHVSHSGGLKILYNATNSTVYSRNQ